MSIYAIGDIQGCCGSLEKLLDKIRFDASRDRLWFVGDLINRGPDSLATLRLVKSLGESAVVVLGNHDLHLLTVAAGHVSLKKGDTLDEILAAPDREALLEWVRQRPLVHAEGEYLMVHAGLLPQWTTAQAIALAHEAETTLRGDSSNAFLRHLYGNTPAQWDDSLQGWDRLRVIVNAMTRMRFCTDDGVMEFKSQGKLSNAPAGFKPWFDVQGRRSADTTLIIGHWSALGLRNEPNLIALDTGCLWGGQLTALRLPDRQVAQISCPQSAAITSSQ